VIIRVSMTTVTDKEDLGRFIAPEGLEILAQGFNPGNRPPGKRALKGRQIRPIKKQTRRTYYIRPAIAQLCAGAHYFSQREYLYLTNTLFLCGALGAHRTHPISRPFRANRFIGCFPGLKPWAESYSPCGAKHPKRTCLRAIPTSHFPNRPTEVRSSRTGRFS